MHKIHPWPELLNALHQQGQSLICGAQPCLTCGPGQLESSNRENAANGSQQRGLECVGMLVMLHAVLNVHQRQILYCRCHQPWRRDLLQSFYLPHHGNGSGGDVGKRLVAEEKLHVREVREEVLRSAVKIWTLPGRGGRRGEEFTPENGACRILESVHRISTISMRGMGMC